MRDALSRYLWENLLPHDFDSITILPPKKANLNKPGYFDITFVTSEVIKDHLLDKLSDVVISARLSTHTFDPEDKTKRQFDSSIYIKKFLYNVKARELKNDGQVAADYYTFTIDTRSNSKHINVEKLRHAIASKQIANGCTLPIAEPPGVQSFEEELVLIAKGPQAIEMTLSEDWEV